MIPQKRILLVHGIYSREGESSVWHMKAPLEKATGLPVVVFEYGYEHIIQARFENPAIAKRLAHIMEPGDIVVNHSNGAAVTWLATQNEGARPSGVVMINPALDEWRMPLCDWAHVYYNAEDEIVWLSHLLIGNIWGEMGKTGFRYLKTTQTLAETECLQFIGADLIHTRVRQVNTIDSADAFQVPAAIGHLAMFQSPCVAPWGGIVGRRILSEVSRAE